MSKLAKTRLIVWTVLAMIALFFSCVDIRIDKKVAESEAKYARQVELLKKKAEEEQKSLAVPSK
jgi:hypothetical protein